MSSTLLAVGSESWRWQLRDTNGQWIKMGSRVSWFRNGERLTGEVIGSSSPGIANVWPYGSTRIHNVPADSLLVVDPVPDVVPQVTPRAVQAVVVPPPHEGHPPTEDEVTAVARTMRGGDVRARGSVGTAIYLDAAEYNERPTVLPTEAFEAFQGKTINNYNYGDEPLSEFWRGTWPSPVGIEPYTNLTTAEPSDFFVGYGIYSNGTHIGSAQTAADFSGIYGHRIPKKSTRFSGGSAMVRVKIHPDARVGNYSDMPSAVSSQAVVKWAVEHGYDVLDLSSTQDTAAGIAVLNRSVMVVEEIEDENAGRVQSVGTAPSGGSDVSAGGAGDSGLGAVASGLPAEGRDGVPSALGTTDRTHRPVVAAGDSWRWQLRDKNGKWIEMGSEVRYLIRGLYKQGIVVGSPSPGVAKVRENVTQLLRDIPSNRLEVVESAARVVERVFDVGEREADLQDNPALRDLVERSKKGEVSFIGWGDWLLPDEFGPLTDTIVDLVSSRVLLGQFTAGNRQAEAGQLVYEQIGPQIQELGFDDDSAWYLAQAIGIRIVETIHREKQWGTASDRTKTEIAPNLNEVRHTGQIATAVTPETAKQILTDGQFKSQFETMDSKGMYDPVLRTKYETAMFGMHPHMNKRLRAIYGYVYTPGQETSESLDQYGNMRFLLKPEVRSRTTMTAGDSLGTGALPVSMEGPDLNDHEAFMATSAMPRSIGLAASSPKVFQERDYYEAQIHGGLTLDDVQEIVVTLEHRDYYTQKALDEAILLAEQRGIPVRYETPTRYQ